MANQDAADALDSGDVVTDSFNYTVSDGTVTDIAVIEITVIGINDSPVADDETGSIGASNTLTVTDCTSDLLHGDTDVDASASLNVTSIVATTAGGSATAVTQLTSYLCDCFVHRFTFFYEDIHFCIKIFLIKRSQFRSWCIV